jgi:hypothetical protein
MILCMISDPQPSIIWFKSRVAHLEFSPQNKVIKLSPVFFSVHLGTTLVYLEQFNGGTLC